MRKAGHLAGGGGAFPANGLYSALSGPGLSAEDLLPSRWETMAGQALSSPLTLRCASLPPQPGL